MSILNEINNYAILIAVSLVALVILAGGLYFYFVKIKKVTSAEENVDYKNFIRTDVSEFVKFEDIIECDDGMGILSLGGNVFIGGIEVNGYNFSSASAADREMTMQNAIAFFNTIESSVQMCQNVETIDISQNIHEFRKRAEEIEIKMIDVQTDIKIAISNMERFADNDDMYAHEEARVKRLIHTFNSLDWQLSEAKEMVYYMEAVSDASFNTKRTNQLIFSYYYNPDEDIEELSKEEIIMRAQAQLKNQAEIYGSALENTGCTWKMLSAENFTEILRRHFHPITAEDTRLEELLNSSYRSLYITTNSIEELARERKNELDYERELAEYEAKLQEEARKARRSGERAQMEAEQIAMTVS